MPEKMVRGEDIEGDIGGEGDCDEVEEGVFERVGVVLEMCDVWM